MKKLVLLTVAIFAAIFSQAQWEPDVRLTNDPGSSRTSWNNGWNIATTGETVHVVWHDDREGHFILYYKRSTDGGITWGTDTRLTYSPSVSQEPHIAVSGDSVFVVWHYNHNTNLEIYFKRSIDGGLTWGEDIRLTNRASTSKYASIAVSGSVVHVAWIDYLVFGMSGDVYYKQSIDGGDTWGEDTQLTNTPGYTWHPTMAVSGSVLHLVYYDYQDNWWEIHYLRSTDKGLTWEPDVRLTNEPKGSYHPSICSAGLDVHVAWYDSRDGETEIYYKRSTDGGITWKEDVRLTNAPGSSLHPSIAADGSNVHIVWHDNRDGNGYEIYYKHSEDAGLSWNVVDTSLTQSYEYSEHPSIALAGSIVHVVWVDVRNGNDEIYYKRNPIGNLIVGTEEILADNSMQSISIYPNPASSNIHIHLNDPSILKSILSIWNILGEPVVCKQIQTGNSRVDISTLQNGIYFVEIKTPNNQDEFLKLIILK